MVMETDHNLVLVRNRPEPPGRIEVVIDFSVRHIRIADAAELDDMDIDSRIIVQLAEDPVLVHRNR